MLLLLLVDPLGQILLILDGACDLALGGIELVLVHLRRRSRQTPAGTVGDGNDHRQIPQQFIGWRWGLRLDLLMCFEKQLWILENAATYPGRGLAPSGGEFTGLAAREAQGPQRIRRAF